MHGMICILLMSRDVSYDYEYSVFPHIEQPSLNIIFFALYGMLVFKGLRFPSVESFFHKMHDRLSDVRRENFIDSFPEIAVGEN